MYKNKDQHKFKDLSKHEDKLAIMLLILFFSIIILIDSLFIYLAKDSYNGVVTDGAYNKGLKYNDVLLLNKKQASTNFNIINELKCENSNNVGTSISVIEDKAAEREVKRILQNLRNNRHIIKNIYDEKDSKIENGSIEDNLKCKLSFVFNGIEDGISHIEVKVLRPTTDKYDNYIIVKEINREVDENVGILKNDGSLKNKDRLRYNDKFEYLEKYSGEFILPMFGLWEIREKIVDNKGVEYFYKERFVILN